MAQRLTHIEDLVETQGRRWDWLAERTGLTPDHLTHIVAGRRPMTQERAERIAAALGVPVAYILQAPPQEVAV